MTVIIGTSGWQYRDWRGAFYPQKLAQRLWLEHYVEHFATVESNNAFYRLPERETFVKWRERTPPDFRWAVKASRFLTHIKRLREPEEPVARLMGRAAGLEAKLDTILLQLPPTLKADPELLRTCLAQFPSGTRVAVEPRHESWWTDEIRALLERYGAALCWADRMEQPVAPLWRTADWGYLRFHTGLENWRYRPETLQRWADRLAARYGEDDVLVYFNNDPGCAAVIDACLFADAVRRAGGTPTRVPTADQATGLAWAPVEVPPV
ncbi:DUF72 domain-containing protein [Blastococcus sp. SYSU DS0973]